MSNVFRSFHTISEEGKTRKIGIRTLVNEKETGQKESLSLEEVLAERDRLLFDARSTIDIDKQHLEQMRQTALDDIAAMKASWEQEKEKLQQETYDEAFQIGFEEGRNKALAEMAQSIQKANEITERSLVNATSYVASQERVILEIAMRSAERILGQSLQENEELYISVVKKALKEARETKEIKLYVSPEYFELVSSNRPELASIFPPDVPFLIFANDDFDSLDCYIETNHGRIVVTIDEQLNELRERLIELMESGD